MSLGLEASYACGDVTPRRLPSQENANESARNSVRSSRVDDDVDISRNTSTKTEIDNDLLVAAMRQGLPLAKTVITIRWNIVLPVRVFLVAMAFNTVLLQILRTVLDFLLTTASELTGLTVDVMEPWSMIRLVFEILMPTMRSVAHTVTCLLYTSPSPRDKRQSRMPSSA